MMCHKNSLCLLCLGLMFGCSSIPSDWPSNYVTATPINSINSATLALISEDLPQGWNVESHGNIVRVRRLKVHKHDADIIFSFYDRLSQTDWEAIASAKRPGHYNEGYAVQVTIDCSVPLLLHESPRGDAEAVELEKVISERLKLLQYRKTRIVEQKLDEK